MTQKQSHNVDLAELAQAAEVMKMFQAATPPQPGLTGEVLGNSIIKILVAVCTAAVLWTANSVNTNTQTISEMQVESRVWRKGIDQDIAKLKNFSDQPRYTREMDIAQDAADLAPVQQMLNRHESELGSRGEWMSGIERRMSAIEFKYESILSKLTEINTNLESIKEKQ